MNNTILNSDTLNEMLDVSRNALHTTIRTKQNRQKMSNTQSLTTEEKIGIAGNHEADRIKLIKELMEEEVMHFNQWKSRRERLSMFESEHLPLPSTFKGWYELYKQSK